LLEAALLGAAADDLARLNTLSEPRTLKQLQQDGHVGHAVPQGLHSPSCCTSSVPKRAPANLFVASECPQRAITLSRKRESCRSLEWLLDWICSGTHNREALDLERLWIWICSSSFLNGKWTQSPSQSLCPLRLYVGEARRTVMQISNGVWKLSGLLRLSHFPSIAESRSRLTV